MKIYTRTGDTGTTGVIGGRVKKDSIRVEAYGTVDELNSFVGQAALLTRLEKEGDIAELLVEIQHELFDAGADLAWVASPAGIEMKFKISAELVTNLEQAIDSFEKECPELKRFILPGGSDLAAALHICRTVCRRAERRVVTLAEQEPINVEVRHYLNRLSDLFFTLARASNVRRGTLDIEYKRGRDVFK